ncbi:unnamed protein product [Hymenolepis diminuta]|uniref:DUF7041 domain-containing protein n=1 Tax=Hymenolepis diminuta TaxID=6216 RepID=A0A564YPF4_HYMDI|nr:unnamed protein product [Hymenolepis diminuta]
MFQRAFSTLLTNVAAEVTDIADKTPEENSYSTLKRAVISRLSDSQEKQHATASHRTREKRKGKTPKSTAMNQQKPSQSLTQHRSPNTTFHYQRKQTTRINRTKTIPINIPISSQPPSTSTKLQTINRKLQPSILPKATLTKDRNIRNLLALNNESKSSMVQTPREGTTDA